MKIIHISDIHGDFETFDKAIEVVKKSDADILAITGDLAGSVFEGKEKEEFREVNKKMWDAYYQLSQKSNGQIENIRDSANFLFLSQNVPNNLKEDAKSYLEFEKEAEKRMKEQYNKFNLKFENLVRMNKNIVLVPGNWDGKSIEDVLGKYNIHNKPIKNINDVGFVGYGSSTSIPFELPADIIVSFDDEECFSHLSKYEEGKFDVVLTHECPFGFNGNKESFGSWMLRAYVFEREPSLLLYGHSHNPVFANVKGIAVSNPGNLGRYLDQDFGNFLEIELDRESYIKLVKGYNVKGDSVIVNKFEEK